MTAVITKSKQGISTLLDAILADFQSALSKSSRHALVRRLQEVIQTTSVTWETFSAKFDMSKDADAYVARHAAAAWILAKELIPAEDKRGKVRTAEELVDRAINYGGNSLVRAALASAKSEQDMVDASNAPKRKTEAKTIEAVEFDVTNAVAPLKTMFMENTLELLAKAGKSDQRNLVIDNLVAFLLDKKVK